MFFLASHKKLAKLKKLFFPICATSYTHTYTHHYKIAVNCWTPWNLGVNPYQHTHTTTTQTHTHLNSFIMLKSIQILNQLFNNFIFYLNFEFVFLKFSIFQKSQLFLDFAKYKTKPHKTQ